VHRIPFRIAKLSCRGPFSTGVGDHLGSSGAVSILHPAQVVHRFHFWRSVALQRSLFCCFALLPCCFVATLCHRCGSRCYGCFALMVLHHAIPLRHVIMLCRHHVKAPQAMQAVMRWYLLLLEMQRCSDGGAMMSWCRRYLGYGLRLMISESCQRHPAGPIAPSRPSHRA
jgi:hypothetical protein